MDHSIDQAVINVIRDAVRPIIREELELSLKALLTKLKSNKPEASPAAEPTKAPVEIPQEHKDINPVNDVEAPAKKTKAKKEVAKKAEPEPELDSETSELDDDAPVIANAGELLAAVKDFCAKSAMPKPQAIKMATETLEDEFGIKKFGDVPDDKLMEVYARMKLVLT
jgi:hypothetical protein